MNLRSILFACLAANGAQGTPQTVKIACFGDSVTAGSRAEGQPWCKQLRKFLGTGYFATSNFGRAWSRSSKTLSTSNLRARSHLQSAYASPSTSEKERTISP